MRLRASSVLGLPVGVRRGAAPGAPSLFGLTLFLRGTPGAVPGRGEGGVTWQEGGGGDVAGGEEGGDVAGGEEGEAKGGSGEEGPLLLFRSDFPEERVRASAPSVFHVSDVRRALPFRECVWQAVVPLLVSKVVTVSLKRDLHVTL